MKRHYIPPNYDSVQFSLFGFLRLNGLIEAGVIAFLVYSLLDRIVWIRGFITETLILASSLIVFVLCLAFTLKESLIKQILKRVRFLMKKRSLSYRRIQRRCQIEEDLTKQILGPKQRYTQEYLLPVSFKDGIVETRDGRFVKILEIEAANFTSLKSEEIGAILQDFARLLKIGPQYAQLKVISKRSDLVPYIENLRSKAREAQLSHLVDEVAEQLRSLSAETALEHRYFYIFSYEPKIAEKDPRQNARRELRSGEDLVRSYLGKRGVKVIERDGIAADLFNIEFFYDYYNRQSTKDENYLKRRARVLEDTQRIRPVTEEKPLKLANVLAPRGIDFTHSDYVLMDGLYYTYLTINAYPESGVDTGWLGKFINVGEGFDFDILIERVDKSEIVSKLKKRNLLSKANADQMSAFSDALGETRHVISTTEYLLEKLSGDNEFFYVTVVCTIVSDTYIGLKKKVEWLTNLLTGYSFKVESKRYQLEDAMTVTSPLCVYDPGFLKKNRCNLVTDSLTGFYPYTTASISQIDGIAIGVNEENHSPVILDVFNPVSNLFVFGTTGYGKSFLCMLLASRLRLMQTQVYVIAPIKAHEYRKLTECVGGSFIEIGPGSKQCINILEVRPMYRYERRDDEETGVFTESSYLNEKIQDLLVFFDLITENTISRKARDLLSPFLVSFYRDFGITDDNSSIYKGGDARNGLVTMPIISDLRRALLKSDEEVLRSLAIPLKKFTQGNLIYFNNQTNVDLDNKFCVIDMSKAIDYEETRNLVIYLVQNYVWSRVRADRSHRKAIIYEEIWKLLASKESAETIREVFKTIRGFYGIAIGITQNLEDLTNNTYGVADGILNNTLIQLIMHNASDEANKLKNRFELTDYEYGVITGLERGESLIVTPGEHYKCQVLATDAEAKLFETDGNKLRKTR